MSQPRKPVGGAGARAAAQLRSAGGTSGAAASGTPARRRPPPALLQRSTSSDSSAASDDDSASDSGTDDDDGETGSSDDDRSASPRRHPQPSSDSDTDPLEPVRAGSVSVLSSLRGGAPPVFPPVDPGLDAKGRPFPSLTEEEALQIVLDSNGITREEHARAPHAKGAYLEVFQVNKYRRIQGLSSFGHAVRHVEIMQQNLTSIEGLQALVNLEILYLNNNAIRRIGGLAANTRLQELYLGENQLTKLEGLSHLASLTVLSVYDNQLPAIEGLEGLTKLKKLNLARNRIEEVGNSLDHLTSLIELNLSDNRLATFTPIRHLSRLKQLEILYLNDPHHGDNPVCHLCNYHTYALYHLAHLRVLDTIRLTEEATQLAEATFLKKQMYYNMRIKVCKGNTSNLIKKANEICKHRVATINTIRRELVCALKLVLGEIDEHACANGRAEASATSTSTERALLPLSVLEARRDALEKLLSGYNSQVSSLSSFLSGFSRKLSLLSEQLVQRMVLELESGGNVRFEDGVLGQDAWVLSCAHFLHTHLATPALAKRFGLGAAPGVRVRRVTKIHNRSLRNRFEEALDARAETMGDGSPVVPAPGTKNSKPELHYAFYSSWANGSMPQSTVATEHQEAGNQALLHAAHQGFTCTTPPGGSTSSSTSASSSPALVLTNSVLYADLPRLVSLQRSDPRAIKRDSLPREATIQGGEILIAKVYFGTSLARPAPGGTVNDSKDPTTCFPPLTTVPPPNTDSLVEEFAQETLGPTGGSSATTKSPGLGSPKHAVEDDDNASPSAAEESTKLKRIHVFSRHLVLPEYLVSFDYVRGDNEADSAANSFAGPSCAIAGAPPTQAAKNEAELLRLSGNFVGLREPLIDLSALLARLDRFDAVARQTFQALSTHDASVASQLPSPRADLLAMLSSGNQGRQRQLELLHLSNLNLKSLPSPEFLTGLRVLLLNFNSFTRLDGHGFEKLVHLERLELGYNALRKVAPGVLAPMRALTHLEMPYNALSARDIPTLIQDAPKLQVLDLRGNDLAKASTSTTGTNKPSSYTLQVIKGLPQLTMLDLVAVDLGPGGGREQCATDIRASILHPLMQYQGAFLFDDAATPTSTTVDKVSKTATLLSPYGTSASSASSTSGGSGAQVGPVVSDHLLLQQCFIDRDSANKLRQCQQPTTSSYFGTAAAGARRPLSMYTRVRLSDFLLESSASSSKSASLELPSQFPPAYFDQVLELELDHQRLSVMPSSSLLGRFTNLRKLSFYDNSLTRVSGLEHLERLEELSLEENALTALEGLSNLKSLSKLDVGKNRLTALDVTTSLRGLDCLAQLSLEDNLLRSLAGFEILTSLMELYLGNNRIEALAELVFLKDLPRLLILDMSGNPVSQLPEYRLYAVFTLGRLKVLDGVAIDSTELHSARELHAGKLTEQMLTDILGHASFKHIETLDLTGAKIRNMEVITAERFCNLRVLVLDNNHISDLSTLSPLPLLRVLRLNRNRVSVIPCHEASGRGLLARCFPHLEVLELGFNRVASIAALNLKGLNELRVLTLESNDLTRVDGLTGLPNLQQLVLAKNKIKRLDATVVSGGAKGPNSGGTNGGGASPFAGLVELRGLQLEENGLRSLVGLGMLPKLRALFLAYNRLSELSELDALSAERCSPVLQEVTLRNNPLARKHLYRAALVRRAPVSLQSIDGREVTVEEREKAESLFSSQSGSNGEPLIAPGGMPGAVYFYSDVRATEKVPIRMQSFNLAGFNESSQLAGQPLQVAAHHPHAPQHAHPHHGYHAAPSPTHTHSTGNQHYQPGPIQSGGLGLGIGGISIGGGGGGGGVSSHLNLNLSSPLVVGNGPRGSLSVAQIGGPLGGGGLLSQQLLQIQSGAGVGLGMGVAGYGVLKPPGTSSHKIKAKPRRI